MKKIRRKSGLGLLDDVLLPDLDSKALRRDPIRAQECFNALSLADQVRAVLQRTGKDRLELILLSRKSRSLVQSLPEQEWYLTMKQIGSEDALALLAFSSPRQLTYLFDIEWWYRDILDPLLVIHWLILLMECGQEKVKQWLKSADVELLILVLDKFIRVYKTDPEDEGNEPWRSLELFTLDESYYIHFLDQNLAKPLEKFMRILRDVEQDYYYHLLDDLGSSIPGEQEEAAGHFRQRRMDEYGFPEFDEALKIYAYLSPEKIRRLIEESGKFRPDLSSVPPRYPLSLKDMPRLIGRALSLIESPEAIEELQFELARVSNRVLVADALDLSRLENIDRALKKAFGYIEIGLEFIAGPDTELAARILCEKSLQTIFQVGYSQALRLHYRAERLMREGWPRQMDDPFDLLGPVDGPLIDGLLKPRPLYSPALGEKGEGSYREFETLSEINASEKALTRAEIFGPLFFSALRFNAGDLDELRGQNIMGLTWNSVLCTAFVKGFASGHFSFQPLSIKEVRSFIQGMMTPSPPRRIRNEVSEEFLSWLERRLESLGRATMAASIDFARECLEALGDEFSGISLESLDPRFLECLIVRRASD